MTLTAENRENAKKLADKLVMAFGWVNTTEGHAYWKEVHDKLYEIANPPLPQVMLRGTG